ncbi:uncharacterized protein LOC107823775 isoform X1 [Nicotiana tabacum]|uniref:Uncharacterized protein LOC107823775 isoform X1 n=1 Tax=Nicotiana tabacum TaxID=4097 RepID=A0A1S4CY89_TOBAC|nr:PREDICTED: uncharacterized protein LOC107823775 isoform X1 [Nicotiana tabacum]
MVQLMNTVEVLPELQWRKGKTAVVKLEIEDDLDEAHGPLNKRSKLSSSLQQQLSVGADGFPVPPSQYNPLDEPSPLGLRLRKSPSLLDLIQMKLSPGNNPKVGNHGKKEQKGNSVTTEKLKASNFPASVLRIGSWEYKSRYEGDLVAKCYFAKHKLVWEVLDGGLKNKIEIQWSDIMGLKASYPDDGPGTLDVELARQPLFFRETNPQPRKHTLWQATSDFTGGQASIHKQHYLQCPPGLMGKHFEKLVQCDPRLNFLSQQPEITLDSPYFESRISVFEDPNVSDSEFNLNNEKNTPFLNLQGPASPSEAYCSTSKAEQDVVRRPLEGVPPERRSPISVMDTRATQHVMSRDMEKLKGLSNLEQLKVPGLHPSMSMKDLVSHFEQRFSEQGTSEDINLSSDERQSLQILEDISRCLFSDTQNMPESDEKSLMSRVNSLCCLIQKDPATAHKSESSGYVAVEGNRTDELSFFPVAASVDKVEDPSTTEDKSNDPTPSMSRKDSVGELLMNLPRIASLPQFLFNIYEDSEYQAR